MPGTTAKPASNSGTLERSSLRHARFGPLRMDQLAQVNALLRSQCSQAELIALIAHGFNHVQEMALADFLGLSMSRLLDIIRSVRHRIETVEQRRTRAGNLSRYADKAESKKATKHKCRACGHITRLAPRDGLFCEACAQPLGGGEADR